MNSVKRTLRKRDGWTTMEYVVGAIIIIGIVTTAITAVQNGVNTKSQEVQQQLSN